MRHQRYVRNLQRIEVDITYDCNLKCYNCNRSCRQAPTKERITVAQIAQFVEESRSRGICWEHIEVLGGEPTLHPDLLAILDLLRDYRDKSSAQTTIRITTNGYGKLVRRVLKTLPKDITVNNTYKTSRTQRYFSAFNVAPIDLEDWAQEDFSLGCSIASVCGMGLTTRGYYPCAVAGGIDRVFGFNMGRRELTGPEDTMADLFALFCQYCGHFMEETIPQDPDFLQKQANWLEENQGGWLLSGNQYPELISPSWLAAYDRFSCG